SNAVATGQRSRQDRERSLTVQEPVVEGDQGRWVGRRLCGEMTQAGLLEAADGLGEKDLARRLVRKEAREQAVDALVPLALGPERSKPEAGHRGVDLGCVGVACVANEQGSSQELRFVRSRHQGKKARGREERVRPEEPFEGCAIKAAENALTQRRDLWQVASLEGTHHLVC